MQQAGLGQPLALGRAFEQLLDPFGKLAGIANPRIAVSHPLRIRPWRCWLCIRWPRQRMASSSGRPRPSSSEGATKMAAPE